MEMNFVVYGELAMRTESCDFEAIRERLSAPGAEQLLRMLHAAIGISTEVGEFIIALEKMNSCELQGELEIENVVNFCEEAGDIFWYLSIYYDSHIKYFGYLCTWEYDSIELFNPVMELDEIGTHTSSLAWSSSELLDVMKKYIFYGRKIDQNDIFRKSFVVYKALRECIDAFLCDTGKTYHEILRDNILKLKKRYGDKFSEFRAVNRDTKKELNHM